MHTSRHSRGGWLWQRRSDLGMEDYLAGGQERQRPREEDAAWLWQPGESSQPRERIRRPEKPFVGIPSRIFEAALSFGFTKRESKAFSAVCRKTYGWRKPKDRISYSQIAQMTGLDERNVGETMRNLRDARVLTCEGDPGGGSVLIWGIQEQVELWDLRTLQALRKRRAKGSGQPRVKMALPPRAKTALHNRYLYSILHRKQAQLTLRFPLINLKEQEKVG